MPLNCLCMFKRFGGPLMGEFSKLFAKCYNMFFKMYPQYNDFTNVIRVYIELVDNKFMRLVQRVEELESEIKRLKN
jgi:hypothetical protein